jgi:hypothetical protein
MSIHRRPGNKVRQIKVYLLLVEISLKSRSHERCTREQRAQNAAALRYDCNPACWQITSAPLADSVICRLMNR